jgi:hypothetical protein
MRRCQILEQDFVAWEDSLPEVWRPKPIAWIDYVPGGNLLRAEVYPGKVDLYEDVLIANAWNHVRVSRLFVIGLIIRYAAWICYPVDYRTTPEYATGVKKGIDIVTDVLASVPYHFGWYVDEEGALVAGDPSGTAANFGDLSSPKGLGGFLCMWPLFSVNYSDFATDSQRKWSHGRMRIISEIMGLNQARAMGSVSSPFARALCLRTN